MDLQFYGANCLVIADRHARVVVDDNLAELGAKTVVKDGDIIVYTGAHGEPARAVKLIVDEPGEYEVAGISIYGIPARAHMDEEGQKTATMYKLIFDELSVLITGHIFPDLSEAQLEAIGMVDVMVVPAGGSGYTLDGVGALKLIKKVEPKLVIPTHYDDPGLSFPVPQQPLADALKALAMEQKDSLAKLRLKPGDLTDTTQLIVLERS